MGTSLNDTLSQKYSGLELWEIIAIVLSAIFIIVLAISLYLTFRKKTSKPSSNQTPISLHIPPNVPEDIKEIRVDEVEVSSSNGYPSISEKFSHKEPEKETLAVAAESENGGDSSRSGSFNHSEKKDGSSVSSANPLTAPSPLSGLPEFSHLGWGHWFTLRDLQTATNHFSRDGIIGDGGYGVVYRGSLVNGTPVAVKKLLNNLGQADKDFRVEVEAIGHVRHKNLVRLLGYCMEGTQRMLVYEYVNNGNLEQWLRGDNQNHEYLTWEARLKILIGTAKALAYLHEAIEPKVVHRDIKSSNILIDDKFNSKISDFGLAKLLGGDKTITSHFGSVASKVCECLLRRGPLSSREISRLAESDINHTKVKDILYLLIHHNCVQAFSIDPPDGSESKATVQYIALFRNIIHGARYNKFSKVVNEELGSQCSGLLDGLLSNGRLTLEQLIDRDRDSKKPMGSEAIRDSLQKLVAARFIERVPSPEPVLGNKDEGPAQKKRGAKASKIFKEPESLEERILEAATPVDAIRFPFIFEQDSSSTVADDDSNIPEGKRKQPEVDYSSGPSNEVIWRPNFEELIRRLRHKACVEIVKERRDEGCANVMKAMLEVGRSQEKKAKTDKSVPMSMGSIYEELIKTDAGREMTQARVEACLEQLSATSSYLPAFVIESDDSYIVDFKSIISVAQKDEMESVVMRRYGKEAFRMFRYLSQEDRFVETDKIADAALTEKKDTPQILLKMWKDGYLHMQKLAVTGVYMPFLLWKVNKLIVSRRMLDEMYHASLNLSLRLTHEKDSEKELLLLPMEKLEGALKERRNKYRAKSVLLTSASFKLDDAILLFHDF